MGENPALVALGYVSESDAVQPVNLTIEGHDAIAVVEPGHDAQQVWRELTKFLADEGLV